MVHLTSNNVIVTASFYARLGFSIIKVNQSEARLSYYGFRIIISARVSDKSGISITFLTNLDLGELFDELKNLGFAEARMEDEDDFTDRYLVIKDPDGNELLIGQTPIEAPLKDWDEWDKWSH